VVVLGHGLDGVAGLDHLDGAGARPVPGGLLGLVAGGRLDHRRQAFGGPGHGAVEVDGLVLLVALAEGDAEQAVTMFTEWERLGNEMGLGEPGYSRFRADHVEALLAAGRFDDAAEHAEAMQSDAERLDRISLRS
ncbi:tetratricopeptide repeat protein, partial [Bradyrhizobium sp. NBAIM08]|nr:tetratricopeptide repeat protein [Bradyrhizobium sp. NBAIM08]